MANIWKTAPVADIPRIRLVGWFAFTFRGNVHFCGWNSTEGAGRVSSKLMTYDKDAREVVTASGRVYELGPSGHDMDGRYTLNHWLQLQNGTMEDIEYVTADYDVADTTEEDA